MPDDLWQTCGDIVSRLESRLAGTFDRGILQVTCRDLIESLPAVSDAAIEWEPGDPTHPVNIAMRGSTGQPDVVSFAPLTRQSRLAVQIWLAESSADSAECRQAIEETAGAIAGLMSGAIAKLELQLCCDANDSIEQLHRALLGDQPASSRFHHIAQELSLLLGTQQLSLLLQRRGRYRLVGSSAQPRIDSHARAVIEIESIASALHTRLIAESAAQSTLIVAGDDSESIASYLDAQSCRDLYATLFADGQLIAIGATNDRDQLQLSPQQRLLFDLAVRDVLRTQPKRLADRAWGWLSGPVWRWRLSLVAGLLLIGLCFPLKIHVAAEGRLVPLHQRWIHAPVSGNLDRMAVETGSQVALGEELCEFSSDELEWKIIQLRGERLTIEEQIRIAAARRSDAAAVDVETERRVLESRLQGVTDQLIALEQRQAGWLIQSPISGTVHQIPSEQMGKWVTPCPVTIGQPIIRVIDTAQGYRVELDVADQEIGYVLDAIRRHGNDPVICRFRVRAAPEREQTGTLASVAETATVDRFGKLVIVATIDPQSIDQRFTADSGVVAWIECNRAAAGFVLFRKVIEQVRLWGWS